MEKVINLILKKVKQGEISRDNAYQMLHEMRQTAAADGPIAKEKEAGAAGEDMAVIGLAVRFPGADSIEEFWNNLAAGKESIGQYPAERWPQADSYAEDSGQKDESYARWGGFIDSIDQFAASYFHIPAPEASLIDPQQRLFLEVASRAFQHAGYSKKSLSNSKTGVFVGARMSTYETTGKQRDDQYRSYVTGNIANFIATRVSDFYNLKGPSLVVDTACSSSLVAVHYACRSIFQGESQLALVGGINLHITPYSFLRLSNAGALSPHHRSYVFDRRADGFVIGEGSGAVLLKPLSAALADGDTVYAVIKGSAINNDGSTMGITTPNHEGQKRVIREAFDRAGIDPATVTCIEAHGTGTAIGDPIEIKALTDVFSEFTDKKAFCAVGSVKTNIGHLDTAAGIAGLIKVVLALYHRQLPPTLNCQMPNPRLRLTASPFYPNVTLQDWQPQEGVRRAGVSSFGFGGTNCHVVLQEPPAVKPRESALSREHHLFTLSAAGSRSLVEWVERFKTFFVDHPGVSMRDVCYTVNTGRDRFSHRLAVVSRSIKELQKQLDKVSLDQNQQVAVPRSTSLFYGQKRAKGQPKVVFLFPGQGAQYPLMARQLYEHEPVFREALSECDEIVEALLGKHIVDYIYSNGGSEGELSQTLITQPVMFSINYSLARLWLSWNVKPAVVMGHSLGEYAAACVAGVFSLADALNLVVKRSRLMQEQAERGAMAALFTDLQRVSEMVNGLEPGSRNLVSIASINGPRNVVVSGQPQVVDRVVQQAKEGGIHFSKLAVSHAFHSPLMAQVADTFAAILDGLTFKPVKIPIVCNATGELVKKGTLGKQYWLDHILKPVLFESGVKHLIDSGYRHFLEAGPGTTLSSLVKTIAADDGGVKIISSLSKNSPDYAEMGKALARLFVCGYDVDLDAYERTFPGSRIALPLYPFERERCWVDQRRAQKPLQENMITKIVNRQNQPLLADHLIQGDSILPAVCYWEMVLKAAAFRWDRPIYRLRQVIHQSPLKVPPDGSILLRLHFAEDDERGFQVVSGGDKGDGGEVIHVSGKLAVDKPRQKPPVDISRLKGELQPSGYSPQQIYQAFAKSGVHYGPALQSLHRLWSGERTVLAELRLPEEARLAEEHNAFQPALLDGALQAILGIGHHRHDSAPHTYMPFFVGELALFRPLSPECYGLIELKQGEWGDEILRCDITLTDSGGSVLAAVGDFHFKRLPAQAASERVPAWFYVPRWLEKPRRDIEPAAYRCRLVFCQASPVHRHLVDQLQKSTEMLIKVVPGADRQRVGNDEYTIRAHEPQDYVWLLTELDRQEVAVDQVVHLWTYGQKAAAPPDSERLSEAHILGVLSLFNLVKALAETSRSPLEIRLVSSYSQKVSPTEDYVAVEKGPLPGLAKVVPLEYPHIKCGYYDLPFPEAENFAELESLIGELNGRISEPLAAFYGRCRLVPSLEQLAVVEKTNEDRLPRENGVYLISGGTGGIGFALADFLARTYRARLVLVSRSGLPDRQEWERLLADPGNNEKTVEKIKAIRELESLGAQIVVCRADVSNKEQMLAVKSQVEALDWTVDGIFHTAGVIRDQLIQNKSQAEFLEVFQAKVQGTWILYELFSPQRLDFFVLFSSIVSVFGNPGQADYAAANAFMDTFAHWYGPAISLNWSMWAEAGMAVRSGVIEKNRAIGLKPFLLNEAIEAMLAAMPLKVSQVLLMNNSLEDLQGGERAGKVEVLPDAGEDEENPLEEYIEDRLVNQIARILEVDGAEVTVDENFLELGLDSMSLLNLATWLGETAKISLYPTLLFEYPTVADLARYLAAEYSRQFQDLLASEEGEGERKVVLKREISAPQKIKEPVYVDTAPKAEARLSAEAEGEDIAVIALAGRFPQAPSLKAYWHNFENGIDGIGDIPGDRPGMNRELPDYPDLHIRGGFLDNIDLFDSLFFNISPLEADYMDPQQRLFLEVAWQVLEMSGYNQERLKRLKTGVFVGAAQVEYRNIRFPGTRLSPYMGLGNSLCVIANRVSYLLNLKGPSLTIDTACSSSLVAIHLACQSLHRRESDIAIAGGVQVYLSPDTFVIFHLSGMLAGDGRCKTFDNSADGYGRGEGVGAVLLKPLREAAADGDTVQAVIKGSAVNHDGSSKVGISAPNPRAQKEVIKEVFTRGHINPETIGYIEAHGTGTSLGDPVEIEALTQVFAEFTDKRAFCAIGTAKSFIGHLEAAAGIAGFIRAVLAVKNRKIPPTLHFRQPNSHIPFNDTPFYVNDRTRPWPGSGGTRRAGVSSFGFGGTNCHIVVEEFKEPQGSRPAVHIEDILILTAKTEGALSAVIDDTITFLDENPGSSLHDICFSVNTGKNFFDYRLGILAGSLDQLRDRLEIIRLKGAAESHNPYGIFFGQQESARCKCAFYFGEMLDLEAMKFQLEELGQVFPEFRRCQEIRGFAGAPHHLFSFAVMYTLAKAWISLGLKPSLVMGDRLAATVGRVLKGELGLAETIEGLYSRQQSFAGQDGTLTDGDIQAFRSEVSQNRIDCIIDFNGGKPFSELMASTFLEGQGPLVVPALNTSGKVWASLLKGVGTLVARGIPLDPGGLYRGFPVKRIVMPTYPFQRKRFWIDASNSTAAPETVKPPSVTPAPLEKSPGDFVDFLKQLMGDLLRIGAAEIDVKAHFTTLGIDSLIIQDALQRLERHTGKSLEPSVFMNYPTIQSLAGFLSSHYTFKEPLRQTRPPHVEQPTVQGGERAIAVIGFACRFPGAGNFEEFWHNLANGVDATREIPADRWDVGSIFTGSGLDPNNNCTRGGFIEDIDQFAAAFFDVPGDEAVVMDPQQRLLLEIAWQTFEYAGYSRSRVWNQNIGVFIGARAGTYKAEGSKKVIRALLTGSISNFTAARLSDYFNIKGPSLVFDTACSSSLVAVHYACKSILANECRMALAGGVELKVHPQAYISLNLAKALSPDGRTFAFDKRANGFVPGEGVGAVLLKPLNRAVADGDTVYGLILGSAVNNDGSTMGITTPEPESQKRVIGLAVDDAGVNPETISYIEAHGTGTMIGDPIEIKALTEIYDNYTSRKNYCAIGSVKTGIGHLDTAAGIAGLIKVILAFNHRQIPATLHCYEPNPRFSFVDSPFYLNTSLSRWSPIQGVRRAGISSFGFGGTNCHLVLEEAPTVSADLAPGGDGKPYVFSLSAKSESALKRLEAVYLDHFGKNPALDIRDICFTVNMGREPFPYRRAVVCRDKAELIEKLSAAEGWTSHVQKPPCLAFLFPGQGALYPGMAGELMETEPIFRDALERCSEIISRCIDRPPQELLSASDPEMLAETRITQPLTFAVSYALAQLWLARGIKPSVVMGHSVGEYVAAAIAGVFSLEEALKLVCMRGRLMQDLCKRGSMAVFFTGQERVEGYLSALPAEERKLVSLAAVNGANNIVISGDDDTVNRLMETAKGDKVRTHPLRVSHAFHSPLMVPMLSAFGKVLDDIHFSTNTIDLISNVTGEVVEESLLAKEYWLEHIMKPVQFAASIEAGIRHGVNIFLEVGPKATLVSMVNQMNKDKSISSFSTLNKGVGDWQSIVEGVAQLYTRGVDIDFESFYGKIGRRIGLPTYPFERESYWYDQNVQTQAQGQAPHRLPPYLDSCSEFNLRRVVCHKMFSFQQDMTLQNHLLMNIPTLPAVVYWDMAYNLGRFALGPEPFILKEVVHQSPLQVPKNREVEARIILQQQQGMVFTIQSLQGENWLEHCQGKLEMASPAPIEAADIDHVRKRLSANRLEGQDLYNHFGVIGLEFGPLFRSIKEVWFNRQQALVRLQLPEGADPSPFTFPPSLLDGALQAIITVMGSRDKGDDRCTFVPFFIKEIHFRGNLPARCFGHIVVEESENDEIIHSDVRLMDEGGQVKVYLKGCSLKRVPFAKESAAVGRAAETRPRREQEAGWLFKPVWVKKELSTAAPKPPAKQVVMLMNRDHRHEVLAQRFEEAGSPVIRVYSGKEFIANGNVYVIDPHQPEHFKQLFGRLCEEHDIADLIHLWTFSGIENQQDSWEMIEEGQTAGIFSLFHLTTVLAAAKKRRPMNLRVITSFAQAVTGNESHLAVEKSPLLGMVKVIPLEFPWIKCFVYDTDPIAHKDWARELYDEIGSGSDDILVAYREGVRWVPVLSPVADNRPEPSEKLLKKKGTYLITGGLGGIGLELAKYLARNYQARLLLLARSFAIPREQWPQYCANGDNPQMVERIRGIQEMEAYGSEVVPLKGDVTKPEEMQQVLAYIRSRDIQINGIFHLAGTIADKSMLRKDWREFKEVLEPKVKGTYILSRLFSPEKLDFMLLFSSVASVLGNPGQADYAAANAFMDHYARYLHTRGLKVQAINWPMWSEAGMGVYSGSLEASKKQGFTPLTLDQGLEIVERALAHIDLPQLIVLHDPAVRELLKDHIKGVTAGTIPMGKSRQKSHIKGIQAFITGMVSRLLDIPEADVDPQETFLDVGLDSVTLIEMARKIEESLEIQLYPTIFFEHQTIDAFSRYLYDEHGTKISNRLPASSAAPGAVAAAVDHPVKGYEIQASLPTAERQPIQEREEIAVIGMAARFPQADDIYGFWELLKAGKDVIEKVPIERWNVDEYYDPDLNAEGKTYLNKGGFIRHADQFDAAFFNISPKEAKEMDPQQRIFLEVCYHALEHAGYGGRKLYGSHTAVFVGVSYDQYNELLNTIGPFTGLGNSRAIIANRVSYFMNFHGPSLAVDTLCSSSMVAIHLACKSLLNGECDFALAGGVLAVLNPVYFVGVSHFHGFSPTGQCKTFDRGADGYVPGEGAGVIMLRPLKKAIKNRDCIQAIIKGTAVNHDGRSNKLTAPNSSAQEMVIHTAFKNAGVEPQTISYIEAHGTGTALGDPVEIVGISKAFEKYCDTKGFCAIGSVKTNIGHSEPAAGVAGVLKVVLALKRQKLPPTLHFQAVNPFIDLINTPFYINDKLSDWPGDGPHRAGVSSFGMGGTNAHTVLESYAAAPLSPAKPERGFNILTLSAKSRESLETLIADYHRYFLTADGRELEDICYTAGTGRDHYPNRLAIVGESMAHFRDVLSAVQSQGVEQASASPAGRLYHSKIKTEADTTFVYGESVVFQDGLPQKFIDFLYRESGSREALKRCEQVLQSRGLAGKLEDLMLTQPLLLSFVLAYTLTELLGSWKIVPGSVLGFGVGSYVARLLSETLTLEDAVGQLMDAQRDKQILSRKFPDSFDFSGDKKKRHNICFGKPGPEFAAFLKGHDSIVMDRMDEIHLGRVVSQLYVSGVDIDWEAFYSSSEPRKVELPLYPFDRKSYWPEEISGRMAAAATATTVTVTAEMGEVEGESEAEGPVSSGADDRSPGISMDRLTGKIASIFADELMAKLDFRPEDIDFDANLLDYGFDSVFAVQMMKVYEETVNVSLDPTLLYDYKTINEFSAFLAQEYRDAFEKYFSGDAAAEGDEAPAEKETKKVPGETLLRQIGRIFADELMAKLDFRSQDIDFDASLLDYGFDSVFAVQMMKVYEEKIEVSLDPTLLYDYKTINEFSAYLAGEYETQFLHYFNNNESGQPCNRKHSPFRGKKIEA